MTARFPLSVVFITHNEAENIGRALDAVAWCDECVVVDDSSTDDTISIAESRGARVLTRRFDSFAGQRNWALDHAELAHDWVLLLDADEVVTPELRREIESTLPTVSSDVVAFRMCRKTMFLDRWLKHSDDFPVWIMRLVRRGSARFEDSGHGEVPIPTVDGRVATLIEPFEHYSFSKGILEWCQKHTKYADREARKELHERTPIRLGSLLKGNRATRRATLRAISRRLPARPTLRFLYQYVLKLGFLDGIAGLRFCQLMAWYERLIILRRTELIQSGWSEQVLDGPTSDADAQVERENTTQSPVVS